MRSHVTFKTTILAVAVAALVSCAALAAAPQKINYQGYLRDSGVPVNNAALSMEFRLYDDLSAGGILCTSGAQVVSVTYGRFNYVLGSGGCDLSTIDWHSTNVYLEIWVDGNQMSPREQIVSGVYALGVEGTPQEGFVIDQDNTAAAAASITVRFNRGASGPDAVIGWSEAVDRFAIFKDGSSYADVWMGNASATAFYGDGSGLTNVTASGAVSETGDSMSGPLNIQYNTATSTLAVQNSGGGFAIFSSGTIGGWDLSLTGNATAAYFFGDGSYLANINSTDNSRVLKSGDSMTGTLNIQYNTATSTLAVENLGGGNAIHASGPISGTSLKLTGNATAAYFFGDGSNLTGISGVSDYVKDTGDSMTGYLDISYDSSSATPSLRVESPAGTGHAGYFESSAATATVAIVNTGVAANSVGLSVQSNLSYGITGSSFGDVGIYGYSDSYVGMKGESNTGIPGYFVNHNTGNTNATLIAESGSATSTIYALNSQGSGSAIGVHGRAANSGVGVYGQSALGFGVKGYSMNGAGIYGEGLNERAGVFVTTMNSNATDVLYVESWSGQSGSSLIGANHRGSDGLLLNIRKLGLPAFVVEYDSDLFSSGSAVFSNNVTANAFYGDGSNLTGIGGATDSVSIYGDAMSGPLTIATATIANVLQVTNNGNGTVIMASSTGANSLNPALYVTTDNAGAAAGLKVSMYGAGNAFEAESAGSESAASLSITNAGSTAGVINLTQGGNGPVIYADNNSPSGDMIYMTNGAQPQFVVDLWGGVHASGSIEVAGYASAQVFIGDGSGLTNIPGPADYVHDTGDYIAGVLDIVSGSASSTLAVENVGTGYAFVASGPVRVGADTGADGYDVNFYGTYLGTTTGGLFFDASRDSLRIGLDTGGYWSDGSVGAYSLAVGRDSSAAGMASLAAGQFAHANGAYSFSMGYNVYANSSYSAVLGNSSLVSGDYSLAAGHWVTASAVDSVSIGLGVNDSNRLVNSTAQSMMVGFNSNVPTLFVGPSSGLGTHGEVGIGTATPTATLDVHGGITVALGDGSPVGRITQGGDIFASGSIEIDGVYYGDGSGLTGVSGAPADYVHDTGDYIAGVLDVVSASASSTLAVENTGTGYALVASGPVRVGANTGADGYDVNFYGTYFGSTTGGLFFDASKDALRIGLDSNGTYWNDASVGAYTFAVGRDTKVTGSSSMAAGQFAYTTGSYSAAIGYNVTTSGSYSMTIGNSSTTSGSYSIGMGQWVTAGPSSNVVAIGKGVSDGNRMTNNIANSMMVGFNSNVPTLYIGPASGLGTVGEVGIGTATPTATLDIHGGVAVSLGDGSPVVRLIQNGNIVASGSVAFNGPLVVNGNPGTSGQVLTSNGIGVAPTWQAGGAGSYVETSGDSMTGGLVINQLAATSSLSVYNTGTTDSAAYFVINNAGNNQPIISGNTLGPGLLLELSETSIPKFVVQGVGAVFASGAFIVNSNQNFTMFEGDHSGVSGHLIQMSDSGVPSFVVEKGGSVFASGSIDIDGGIVSGVFNAGETAFRSTGGNADGIYIENPGVNGAPAQFVITSGGNDNPVLRAQHDGTGMAAMFVTQGSTDTVHIEQKGTGDALRVSNSGGSGYLVKMESFSGITTPKFVVDYDGNVYASGTVTASGLGGNYVDATGDIMSGSLGVVDSTGATSALSVYQQSALKPALYVTNENFSNNDPAMYVNTDSSGHIAVMTNVLVPRFIVDKNGNIYASGTISLDGGGIVNSTGDVMTGSLGVVDYTGATSALSAYQQSALKPALYVSNENFSNNDPAMYVNTDSSGHIAVLTNVLVPRFIVDKNGNIYASGTINLDGGGIVNSTGDVMTGSLGVVDYTGATSALSVYQQSALKPALYVSNENFSNNDPAMYVNTDSSGHIAVLTNVLVPRFIVDKNGNIYASGTINLDGGGIVNSTGDVMTGSLGVVDYTGATSALSAYQQSALKPALYVSNENFSNNDPAMYVNTDSSGHIAVLTNVLVPRFIVDKNGNIYASGTISLGSGDLVNASGDTMTGALGISQSAATSTISAYQTNTTDGAGYFKIIAGGSTVAALTGITSGVGAASYGVDGQAGGNGSGVHGLNASVGYGVYGENTSNGYGVRGYSTGSGGGVFADNASSGYGLWARNSASGMAAYFNNMGGSQPVIRADHNSTGNLIELTKSSGMRFMVDNDGNVYASGSLNIDSGQVYSAGGSMTGVLQIIQSASKSLYVENTGITDVTARFVNTGGIQNVISVTTNGGGSAISAENTFTGGKTAYFLNSNSGNNNYVLHAVSSSSGSGMAGYFENTNAGNANPALMGYNSGTTSSSYGVSGWSSGLGSGVYGQNSADGYGVYGVNTANATGTAAFFLNSNAANSGNLILGDHKGTGNLMVLQQNGGNKFVVDNAGAITKQGCPTSMVDMGSYCIDTSTRVSNTWINAAMDCHNDGDKTMCSAPQWVYACNTNQGGLSAYTATQVHWLGDLDGGQAVGIQSGNATCGAGTISWSSYVSTSSFNYLCCYNK